VRNLTLLSIYRVPMPGGSQLQPSDEGAFVTCTCSKHPLWDGYDGDCPIHGWFEPVAADYERMCEGERLL
jgi:hypothetical protein